MYTLKVLNLHEELPKFLIETFIIQNQEDDSLYDLALDLKGQVVLSASGEILGSFSQTGELPDLLEECLQAVRKNDFHPRLALEMLGGNENLFQRSKQLYLENYSNLESEIRRLESLGDFPGIRSLLHKIKGFSLYLGSNRLYDTTRIIEEELAWNNYNPQNISYFLRLHTRIIKYCQE